METNIFVVEVLIGCEWKMQEFNDLQKALDVYLAAYKFANSMGIRARGSLLKKIDDNGSEDYVSIAKFFVEEKKD